MIKRITLLCLSLICIFSVCVSVSAQPTYLRVYDDAGLLEENQIPTLENKLNKISEEYGCEVIVATANDLYKDPMDHADDKLKEHFETTSNSEESGICLLVSMTQRKYGIYVTGKADEKIFKDSDMDELEEAIKPYLSEGEVHNAFCTFADECEETIDYYYSIKVEFTWILIALGVGIAIAFIVVFVMKSQLKSVRYQPAANNYLKEGSLNVTEARDIYLYSTVVRTEKPKANTSSSGGGGGSGRSGSF